MEYRYAPILPIALLSSVCFGQTTFEHADQRTFHVSYGECVAFGDGWLVAGMFLEDDGTPRSAFLRAIAANGDPVWEVSPEVIGMEPWSVTLGVLSDGSAVAASNLVGCDVLLPFFLAERRDATGDTIWSRIFNYYYVSDVDVNAGDSLVFGTETGLLITNAEGDSLTGFATAGYYPDRVIWEASGALLVSSAGALSRWSMDGELLASTQSESNLLDLRWWNGQRAVLFSDNMLRIFDENLNAVDSLEVGLPDQPARLLLADELLLVAANTTSLLLDPSLTIVGSIGMDPSEEFPDDLFRSFAVNDSLILQVASANTWQNPAGLTRTVALNGQHSSHDADVRIELLAIDSVYYDLQNGMVFPHADATVRITNMAAIELNDVVVCHRGAMGPICGQIGSTVHVADAALATGEYLDVPLTGMWLNYAPWEWLNVDQQVCIAALSPDELYDRDQSDNLACGNAHIVLGIGDHGTDGAGVIIGNPFSGAIDIAFTVPSAGPCTAMLFDATGRQLAAITIAAGNTRFRWELPGLATGIHALRLESAAMATVRKLLHQEP